MDESCFIELEMRETNRYLAETFWQTHFPELTNTLLTEVKANETDFWDKFQTALEETHPETLWAIVMSNLNMQVETIGMRVRISSTAKQLWHKKQD